MDNARYPSKDTASTAKNSTIQSKSRQRRKRSAATADPPIARLASLEDSRRAVEICDKVLKNRLVGDRDREVAKLLRLRPDEVVFWPEHFVIFFTLVAIEAGIDVRAYGMRLNPKAASPEHIPGVAFRTVSEVAGVYRENPGALTLFKVQRAFLVTVTAALIGIATGKLVDDAIISGALGGVGGLLINILAQRYLDDSAEPETDWLEELILATLQRHGPMSIVELNALTNIHRPLLNRTLRTLVTKKLIVRSYRWNGGRTVIYGVERIDYDRR